MAKVLESLQGGDGQYVNYFRIAHTQHEFMIAFAQLLPGDAEPVFNTRVVTTAAYAQLLWEMLGDALAKYREDYGSIEDLKGSAL